MNRVIILVLKVNNNNTSVAISAPNMAISVLLDGKANNTPIIEPYICMFQKNLQADDCMRICHICILVRLYAAMEHGFE